MKYADREQRLVACESPASVWTRGRRIARGGERVMASEKQPHVTEKESLRVAEAARQTEWEQPSFMRELFLGRFRKDLIYPFPLPGAERPEFTAFYDAAAGLPARRGRRRRDRPHRRVPAARDRRAAAAGRLRHQDPEGVRRPRPHARRVRPRDDAARQPLRQRRLAALGAPVDRRAGAAPDVRHARSRSASTCRAAPQGEISAFALTEPEVGSDPARVATTAVQHARRRRATS